MKAETTQLHQLFQHDVRYLIPTFQRPYVWTQRNQWDPLWEDVRGTAERYLEEQEVAGPGNDGVAADRTPAHFLGAVVIQQQQTMPYEIPRWLVIDGQQRLTTLQLLLDAAQEVTESLDLSPAMWLSKLVLNDRDKLSGQQDHIFKVWPTLMDQDAFRHAMHNGLPSGEYEKSNVVKAHEFFKTQVREWIKHKSADQERRALALLVAITQRMNLVVIQLDKDESPHTIFETLNARGTALLQADLVKNFVLHEASAHGQNAIALHNAHMKKLEDQWWRKEVAQGRLSRPRVDIFLNYWIVMRKMDEVPATDVFRTVREYAGGRSVVGVATDIGNIADIYRSKIEENRKDSTLGRFLYRWRVMQMGVITPVLMRLLSDNLDKETEHRCLRIIESYLVRRMICKMTAKDYNNLFLSLLQQLNDHKKSEYDEVIKQFLMEQNADARLWPDDRQLEESLVNKPLFRLLTRGRLRFVLEGIEEKLRDPKTEDIRVPKNLTIEHVMPQGWRDADWPLPESMDDPAETEAQRERLIHTVGNLTLATKRLNSTLSNAPWNEKRGTINKYSILRLKESITSEDVWNEDAIKERSRYLAKVAAEVWPHADRI